MSDLMRQKKDTNAAFNRFMDSFQKSISSGTIVAKIGKIKEFDSKNMTCQVMPLPSDQNSLLINVPVASIRSKDYVIHYPLKADDYVVLLFMDNDIDQILLGNDLADTRRGHDISDCVAIGGISLFNDELDIVDTNGLSIQRLDGKASIVLNESGAINIKAESVNVDSSNVNIKGKAMYNGREIARRGDPIDVLGAKII